MSDEQRDHARRVQFEEKLAECERHGWLIRYRGRIVYAGRHTPNFTEDVWRTWERDINAQKAAS